MLFVYTVIHWIITLYILLVIVQTFLSYFVDRFNRARQVIDNLVNPILNPIRRLIPPTGVLDFSPMVLIILLWLLDAILARLFLSLA